MSVVGYRKEVTIYICSASNANYINSSPRTALGDINANSKGNNLSAQPSEPPIETPIHLPTSSRINPTILPIHNNGIPSPLPSPPVLHLQSNNLHIVHNSSASDLTAVETAHANGHDDETAVVQLLAVFQRLENAGGEGWSVQSQGAEAG
jgi:hypothetical protein